ncbi:hypothetical protein [Sphingomonas sp. LaA6.9]|uniref:hypothetical protein n=1 Tax=Sphingomonas sp. LaA6.9 TaxID=2919914 RepID=UPI001F4FAE97|nr:hypothetical protein [Sphingomonas sp. LaA6.9]MCJ8157827.1 hypothetical protein [Sphingomonas sp. LaA6.9]
MTSMTNSKFGSTMTAIVCTILFSATCVLSAVGPAQAADTAKAPTPVVRVFA